MIRRLPAVALLLAALVGVVFLAMGAGGDKKKKLEYKVVLDNAFGLTTGADLRVAGVKVGSIDGLDVERKTARAIATVSVEKPAFGRFKRDVRCTVQPQSLIGEYFLDCDPGKSPQVLASGSRVPASQTYGTVPPDLVQGILRAPYHQRLGLILDEFGAGLGARGPELNRSIRRAIPALQQTDRALKVLADDKAALQSLITDGDTVVTELARRREGVVHFVREARDTAAITATRSEDLQRSIRGFPSVLRELKPALKDLGTTAREQTPALRDLRLAAAPLTQLATNLGPFTQAAGPAIAALGRVSATGRTDVKAARPTVRKVRKVARAGVEPLTNLRFVLEDLDNRDKAVEPNKLAPDPAKGFTGLEAFLNYFFVQAQGINIYDERGHFLKLNLSYDACSRYASAVTAKANPDRRKSCGAALGPSAPGIDTDLNPRGGTPAAARATRSTARKDDGTSTTRESSAGTAPAAPAAQAPATTSAPGNAAPATPSVTDVPKNLGGAVKGLLDYLLKP